MPKNKIHFNKYHAKKVTFGGMTFDSKKECNRYKELFALELAGEISNLMRQVKFELIPSQTETEQVISAKTGKVLKPKTRCLERPVYYVADFTYLDKNGKLIVEDTKGLRTKDYIVKRKLLLYVHHIRIKEV